MSGPYRSRGVLRGLADVRFEQMVTPRLIGCLYVVGAAVAALAGLAAVAFIAGLASWLGAGWWIFAPVVVLAAIAAVLMTRVVCEWVLMAFTRGRPIVPRAPAADQRARTRPGTDQDGRGRQEGRHDA
ncbi:DUF4282 domain-containing protein [Actinomadura sp. 6N118]|uniref:DUF4282 domain-containing protein n=1 Tax=Actinomadura sp. 6N118 TaxID=3375151 RepID=UPI0037B17415